jgi:uncharacterized membrane protein YdjX (TVP38/TMEM64 family)
MDAATTNSNNKQSRWMRVLVLVFVIGITALLLIFQKDIQKFKAYGYPGIFVLSILANGTVIIPLPGVVITTAMGAIFNPFWVAVAAGAGAAIGEMTGYMAGFSGQNVVARAGWYEKVENWMRKYGNITIVVLAFIPNPLFDMAGMTAGALKYKWYRFLFWCALGKILKMMMFSYGGATILNGLFHLFQH